MRFCGARFAAPAASVERLRLVAPREARGAGGSASALRRRRRRASVKERTDAEILDASARVRVLTKLNELAMDALDLGDVTVEGDDDDGTGGGDDARALYMTPFMSTLSARDDSASQRPTAPVSPSRSMASPAPSISNRTFDLPPRLAVATRSTRVDATSTNRLLGGGGGAGAGAGFTVVGFADAMTASFARASLCVFSLVSFAVSVVRTASFASSLELALELATAAARPAAAGEENFFNHAGSLSLPSPPSSRSAGISMIFLRLGVSVDALACRANPRRRQWCSFSNTSSQLTRARKRSHPVVASPSPASSRETHLDRTPHAFEETRERFKLVIIARIVVDDDHDESIDRSARHRLTTRPSRERPRRRARVMELDAPGEIVISSVPGLGFAVDIIEPAPERGRARRGDALVVHGLNAHARSPNVRAMCVALAKRGYRAITFDLPGHGACEGEGSVRGIYTGKEETATRARRALEAAGATRAAMVVGSSMGGALAIYIVNSMREMGDVVVERVVLINPLLKMKTYVPGAALAASIGVARGAGVPGVRETDGPGAGSGVGF